MPYVSFPMLLVVPVELAVIKFIFSLTGVGAGV